MIFSAARFLFIAWALSVAVFDCRSRRIPNSLVVAGLAAALLCALLKSGPFDVSVLQSLIGAVIGLAALMPFFALRVMGAADVKVFAVLGAWCGLHALPGLWIAATVAGGLHALWLVVSTHTPIASFARRGGATFALGGKASTPYAACLTGAALAWLVMQTYGGVLR